MIDNVTKFKLDRAEMRSAAITSSVSRSAGGLFWSVRALCSSLIENGCETRSFGVWDEYTDRDRSEWGNVPLSVSRIAGPRAFGYQPDLLSALRAYQPQITHVHGLWMYPSVAALFWSQGTRPYVVSPHGMLDPWAVRNSAWKKKIATIFYEGNHLKGASCFRALCAAEFEAIRAYGLKNPIAVIPNGVDIPNLNIELPPPVWNLRVPKGAKVLFFLSRLHPKKGLAELLKAWAAARARGVTGTQQWHLVIAGWEQGGHQSVLEQLARELGILDSTHFVGPQFDAEKAASFRRADAFVLPSLSEGLPMAVLEAWGYKLPVLMTPQCNLPEGFAADAAIRVDPNSTSLFEGLATLFSMSAHERDALAQRGRQLVIDQYTWTRVGAEMVKVYRWILGQDDCPNSVVQR